jgi:MFS family permease
MRRNITLLVLCQAVLGAQMPLHFAVGGLAGQILASNKCWATLPISMTVLGSMITAPFLSNIMQKFGRKPGFLIGVIFSTLGSAFNAYALFVGSFALLLLGSLFIGVYMSAQGFYRFAAADTASDEFRPKAISYVMAGGLASAIIGPQLANLTQDSFAIQFVGAYLAIIVVNFIGTFFILALSIPKPKPAEEGASGGRSYAELLRSPRIITAMICGMVSYALMNLVMTSTPLAVVGCGYSNVDSNNVVMAHVIGMFAPAFVTGHLIARFGSGRVIAAGLTILAAAGAVALSGVNLSNFFLALILLGIGWNFGFIGATAMLTAQSRPEEKGRVQGMNDFFIFGMVTLASVASGGLMNCSGSTAVQGWSAVNYAMIPFLALAGLTLIWYLTIARRQSA